MKTVTFQNQQFLVPDWAKFITSDEDGFYVWEYEPFVEGIIYRSARGMFKSIAPVFEQQTEIMEIV